MKTPARRFQSDFFRQYPLAESVFELFHQLPNAYLYVKDRQSRFVHVNHQLLSLFDLTEEADALGKSDRDFQTPALAEAYVAEDRRVMESRRAITGQLWLVPHIRGTPHWFVSSKTPLFNPKGEVVGLAGVMFRVERPLEQERYFGRLKPSLDYIEANFARTISVGEAAAKCGMSLTTFNRQFRKLLRMSPTEYLLAWRIETAKSQLTGTQRELSRIAMDCGFVDQSHFTKRFRKMTGLTPLAYRKQFKK